MSKSKQEVTYKKRGKYYYFKTKTMTNFKTTEKTTKSEAERFVLDLLSDQKQPNYNMTDYSSFTFKKYAKDFFDYEKCPRLNRLRAEGKTRTKRSCDSARKDLVNFVFKTHFASLKMKDIRKTDVLQLRQDLLKKTTPGRVNDIIGTVRTVFSEAEYNEHVFYNPASKISKLKEEHKTTKPFTYEELSKMFDVEDEEKMKDIWGTYADFVFSFIECNTGMRNGEVRALKWKNVDFENNVIYVDSAFKDQESLTLGPPKNNKSRIAPLCSQLKRVLLIYRDKYCYHIKPEDFVCCHRDRTPFNYKRNIRHQKAALEKADVEYRGMHTFRHSFNTNLTAEQLATSSDLRATSGWSDERIRERYTHIEMSAAQHVSEAQEKFWIMNEKKRETA